METKKTYIALGLMSGTSADGVDASILETDGYTVHRYLGGNFTPYSTHQSTVIKNANGKNSYTAKAQKIVTDTHIQAISECLKNNNISANSINYIGFHGQTTYHDPKNGITKQIGDAQKIADAYCTPVVADFRTNDVASGGQGAPLAPIYHHAICTDKNTAFLNLGGVGNITICTGYDPNTDMIAFDTGPANALMDDYMHYLNGTPYDINGQLAQKGTVNKNVLSLFKSHSYFTQPIPKSLDRNTFASNFTQQPWVQMSPADCMATLLEMTVWSITDAIKKSKSPLEKIILCGGGAHNKHLVHCIKQSLRKNTIQAIVQTAVEYGLNNDMLEAEAFAFLAVRHVQGLPLSYPNTTGVNAPCEGGVLFTPKNN